MSEARFLSVTFDFKHAPDEVELNAILDRAKDWVKFAPESWLLWTTSTPDRWNTRLKKVARTGDRFVIFEVDISQRSGVMPRSFWEFIRSHSESNPAPSPGSRRVLLKGPTPPRV